MASTSWNDDEEGALMYLHHRAQVLYLRGLRRYMDFSTGIVGDKRRVSLQQMRECLEVNPDKESKQDRYQPTYHAIRASLAQLERHGLIRRLPKAHKLDPMRFFLPLASIRPHEEPQMNRKGTTASDAHYVSCGYDDRTANEPQSKNRIPPVSVKTPVFRARVDTDDGPNEERPPAYAPADRAEWGRVLGRMGFSQEKIFSAKSLPMLQSWVDRKVTLGEFQQAVEVAHAANGGLPATVMYYRWSVDEIVKNRGQQTIGGSARGQGQRGRESGASILARGCAGAFEPDEAGD